MDTQRSARDVVAVRERLIEKRGGAELRAALTELYELWLTEHARACGVHGGGLALLAVGALGRGEVQPYSDLDLLLVYEHGGSRVQRVAEALWYPMWDAGIGLDHAVRTLSMANKTAAADPRTALGLLEARYLAGDAELAERLRLMARTSWRGSARRRIEELAEANEERWARAGELAQRAEPDLKHGRGGLRDFQVLWGLAHAQLIERPGERERAAAALLTDVRTELHRIARRSRDVLRGQDSTEVAGALGMSNALELAREVSGAGRTIAYALGVAMRAARPVTGRIRRTPLDEGVVLHGGEVALAKSARSRADPALPLRAAAAAAAANAPISTGTLAVLARESPEPGWPWPASVHRGLLNLLGSGGGLVEVIEALDRAGLWTRLFPEWAAVRDLPPGQAPHRYTVDRHLVQTCVHAAEQVTTVARPDLLLLGALVHDIGKGHEQDHSVLGARIAGRIGERIGLAERDRVRLEGMVRHHLLLPHTATRRDVADPVTIERVTEAVGGDVVLLELLHALTKADSLATGPGMWSSWKAALVAELVAGVRANLAGKSPETNAEPSDAEQRVLAAVRARGGVELVLRREQGSEAELLIAAADRSGLLARVAGTLVLHGLRMHAARVTTVDGYAVQHYTVEPRFGALPDPAALRDTLRLALADAPAFARRITAKERDYASTRHAPARPRVLWFDEEASEGSVLELRAIDSIGLLYHLAAVLERHQLRVHWARASTIGPTAFLAVCCTDPRGGRLEQGTRSQLETALLRTIREST